jgi:serine/threonine-protein kinase
MTDDLAGLPATIGRHEVRSLLGRGGMGRVVLARDPVLQREVALKLVELEAGKEEHWSQMRSIFHREARATAALRHPGIVEVYDYSEPEADLLYLTCERLEGPTLRQILDRHGTLPAYLAAALGHEIALALKHAHDQGIVHRDLKPENIFWLPSGRVVLSDFGIARALDGSSLGITVRYGATSLYGSPAYMAPEQLGGAAASPASDLHALGAVLYETLTGKKAFDGSNLAAIVDSLGDDHRPILPSDTGAPPDLIDAVHALLARDPAARPPSAQRVAAWLRDALDALEVTDPRAALRDAGDRTIPIEATEEDEAIEMFAREAPDRIVARTPKAFEMHSRISALLGRGPVVLGMLGVGLLIGAGAYMFIELSELPVREQLFRTAPVVVTEPGKVSTENATEDIYVLLLFPGRAAVHIDGAELGSWEGQVRLGMPPGAHVLEVVFASGTVRREVMLLAGTSPVFEFAPPEGNATQDVPSEP